jgi:conjugal transfer pilus assembly protein TraB
MAEKTPLSPKAKKWLIYGGLGLAGSLAVYVATLQTEKAPTLKEPEGISLTGNVDTRSVSLEGLSRRLADLESGGAVDSQAQRNSLQQINRQISDLSQMVERIQTEGDARVNRMIAQALKEVVPVTAPDGDGESADTAAPVLTPTEQNQTRINEISETLNAREEQRRRDAEAERLKRARDRDERSRRESIYVQPEPIAQQQAGNPTSMPAPRIAVYRSDKKPVPEAEVVEPVSSVPDLTIPAGSIMTAMLLTGLDAPTGARAQSQPVPVLMRIKKEAIMPNYAWADVKECHLLGSAYGELSSERVNIRGETVSCVLADNTAVEGSVKFFVTGEDGKNGVRGTLVSRSGRVLASAAGAALAQGILSSMQETSAESVFLGGGDSGSGGAVSGASEGFDLLTEYYLDLAEQTFPVIEIPNGRWVDVVLTEMLTVKFKG